MKNTKITKIALIVLSVALLLGTVIGFTVNAAEATEYEILAKNVIYGDRTNVVFAVNATVEEANAGTVKVAYKWGEDGEVKNATLLDTTDVNNLLDKTYPAFAINGVALKELGNVVYATAYTGDAPAEDAKWVTYSAAEYFYSRLYKDGFVNKTEADGKDNNRKLLYQSMLESGKQAQIVLDYNTDKLVTEYNYVYTTHADVTIAGDKAAFDVATVEPTYIGSASCVGWISTDLQGNATEHPKAAFAVSGVIAVTPKIEVHVCADENKDHKCDKCGEVTSVCADSESSNDGRCDVCNLYTFEYNVTNGVNLYSNTSTSASGQILQNSITTADPFDEEKNNKFGARAFLATDPTNSANTVLQVVINNNGKDQASKSNPSVLTITPSEAIDSGNVHVLEFDFNLQYFAKGTTGKNLFQIVVYGEDGELLTQPVASNTSKTEPFVLERYTSTSNYTSTILIPSSVTDVKQNAFAFGYGTGSAETSTMAMFDSCKWYRVRITFDQVNSNVIYDISPDNGNTWYRAYSADRKTYEGHKSAKISALGINFNHYSQGGTILFDDIRYVVTDAVPANNGILYNDAVEHPAN